MKKLTVTSDRGGVLIGNENFKILVQNNYGDGDTSVFIIESEEDLPKHAIYQTAFEGQNINIYADDSNYFEEVVETLNGRFAIFTLNGTVYFFEL